MKTSRFPHFRAALLGTGLFVSLCSAAIAGEILFEDSFKVASDHKTLEDLNRGADGRQQGSLAPAVYWSNGATWQSKMDVDPAGHSLIRLYPSANRVPLVLSPSWYLSEEPGEYSLALQLRPRSWATSEGPERILIALGAEGGNKTEGAQPDLAGAILVEIRIDPADGTSLLHVIFDDSEAAPQVELPVFSEPDGLHEVKIRWKQAASRSVESIAVEVDGTSVLDLPKTAFTPRGSTVFFGGQVGPSQQPASQFADMSISKIQYARE